MKDLEKIKSEDLGCQVQDANPANFAIEQEVAQLVGATVPQPTEPSSDDARELGAQLLVFLRRALMPIQTALRTAVAAIYAHLDSRCTDYTPAAYASYIPRPYDPMTTPRVPRTLPNLLTAITAFSDRKISGVPEAADGVSLVHLVCNTATLSEITELTDETRGWTMDRNFFYQSTIKKATFGFKRLEIASNKVTNFFVSSNLEELHLPDATYIGFTNGAFGYGGKFLQDFTNLRVLDFPELETYYMVGGDGGAQGLWNIKGSDVMVFPKVKAFYNPNNAYTIYNWTECRVLKFPVMETIPSIANATWLYGMPALEELHIPMFKKVSSKAGWPIMISNCPLLRKTIFGVIEDNLRQTGAADSIVFNNCPQMIHFEIGDGVSVTFTLNLWNPTMALRTDTTAEDYVDLREDLTLDNNLAQFLQNFREHIALRLTDNGSGKTLTLSQAVRNAIHAAESTYGIENIIVTQKGWTISPAPN